MMPRKNRRMFGNEFVVVPQSRPINLPMAEIPQQTEVLFIGDTFKRPAPDRSERQELEGSMWQDEINRPLRVRMYTLAVVATALISVILGRCS